MFFIHLRHWEITIDGLNVYTRVRIFHFLLAVTLEELDIMIYTTLRSLRSYEKNNIPAHYPTDPLAISSPYETNLNHID